jgi:hypothetical protein
MRTTERRGFCGCTALELGEDFSGGMPLEVISSTSRRFQRTLTPLTELDWLPLKFGVHKSNYFSQRNLFIRQLETLN